MNALARGWQGGVVTILLVIGLLVFSQSRPVQVVILVLLLIQLGITLSVVWPDLRNRRRN